MCWQDHRKRLTLDHNVAISNVDLAPVRTVKLQGGEPLAIKSLRRYFDHVTSLGHRVSLITNGTLINDEWAEKIANHSDFIEISINAASKNVHERVNLGSNWERVLKGIARLKDARARHSSKLRIYGHMTLVADNLHEIAAFIKTGQSLGFDELRFGYDKQVPTMLAKNEVLRDRLRQEVTQAARGFSKRYVDDSRLRQLGLL